MGNKEVKAEKMIDALRNNKRYDYEEVAHQITGDPEWLVTDYSLALGGIPELVQSFIEQYNHEGYTLSIYDTITGKTIEVECSKDEMPQIVNEVYHTEKGTPLTFIGVNSLSESYVVGMAITRGRIGFGCYEVKDGKLVKVDVL